MDVVDLNSHSLSVMWDSVKFLVVMFIDYVMCNGFPDWNAWIIMGWIVGIFSTDLHGSLRMNPNDSLRPCLLSRLTSMLECEFVNDIEHELIIFAPIVVLFCNKFS